jgi:hypothetical protein
VKKSINSVNTHSTHAEKNSELVPSPKGEGDRRADEVKKAHQLLKNSLNNKSFNFIS